MLLQLQADAPGQGAATRVEHTVRKRPAGASRRLVQQFTRVLSCRCVLNADPNWLLPAVARELPEKSRIPRRPGKADAEPNKGQDVVVCCGRLQQFAFCWLGQKIQAYRAAARPCRHARGARDGITHLAGHIACKQVALLQHHRHAWINNHRRGRHQGRVHEIDDRTGLNARRHAQAERCRLARHNAHELPRGACTSMHVPSTSMGVANTQATSEVVVDARHACTAVASGSPAADSTHCASLVRSRQKPSPGAGAGGRRLHATLAHFRQRVAVVAVFAEHARPGPATNCRALAQRQRPAPQPTRDAPEQPGRELRKSARQDIAPVAQGGRNIKLFWFLG